MIITLYRIDPLVLVEGKWDSAPKPLGSKPPRARVSPAAQADLSGVPGGPTDLLYSPGRLGLEGEVR